MTATPASASAEYGAQFRTDVESFVSREAVESCVSAGVRERPVSAEQDYAAFCDPSGGSADSITLAIGHKEGDVVVIDALRERKPPFNPDSVVDEFGALLASYKITKVSGDKYAGVGPRERFAARNVTYEPAEKPKSDLYRDMLPLVNARRIDLLDDHKLVSQLCGLERRTTRAGKDSIDHAPSGHDDVANAVVAGVAHLFAASSYYWANNMAWVSDGSETVPQPSFDPRPSLYQHPFFGGLPPWVVR